MTAYKHNDKIVAIQIGRFLTPNEEASKEELDLLPLKGLVKICNSLSDCGIYWSVRNATKVEVTII